MSELNSSYDLADVLIHGQANCLGFSQLFYVFGNKLGLEVEAIFVFTSNTEGSDHVANLVKINDKHIIVDLNLKDGYYISPAFNFDSTYKTLYLSLLSIFNNKKGGTLYQLSSDAIAPIYRFIRKSDIAGLTAWRYTNRATELLEQREYDKGITLLEMATTANPHFETAWYNLGVVYFQLGQYDKAIECLKQAFYKNYRYAAANYYLSLAYLNIGKFSEATAFMLNKIELLPGNADDFFQLGRIFFDRKDKLDFEDLGYFYLATKLDKKYQDLLTAQHTDLILAAKKSGIPLDVMAYENLGWRFLKRTLPQEDKLSVGGYLPSYPLGENNFIVFDNNKQAIKYFKMSFEIKSDYSNTYGLGVAYYYSGNMDEAKKWLLKSVQLKPDIVKEMDPKIRNLIGGN